MLLIFGVPGFLALLIIFIAAIASAASTRVCPYCAERIKKAATACRYCGRDVGPIQIRSPAPWAKLDPNLPRPSRWPQAILAAVFIVVVIVVVYSETRPIPPATRQDARSTAFQPAASQQPAAAVASPTPAPPSPKAQPKDAKPKAPTGPLNIAPR